MPAADLRRAARGATANGDAGGRRTGDGAEKHLVHRRASACTAPEDHPGVAQSRQADHPMYLLAIADAPCVFPPGGLLGIAEQIRPGDVMVVPHLAAAQAGEV